MAGIGLLAQNQAQPARGAAGGQRQQPQGAARGVQQPAAGPKNLQVLPSNLTNQEVVQVMQTFTAALGVTCAHCHVFLGPGNPMNDMASDMKPQKDIARGMLRMAADTNARLATIIKKPADERTRVECMTCHRGAAIPVAATVAPAGGRAGGPQG
jgi:hypothetical protein